MRSIVFESSSFFRGRERRAKERKRCTRLHEREREDDPFEPDDDVNDAKISPSSSFSSCLSQNTQDALSHARAQKKTDPLSRLLVFFSSALLLLSSSGVTKSSTAARQKARTKTRFERLRRTSSSSSSSSSSFWREKKK